MPTNNFFKSTNYRILLSSNFISTIGDVMFSASIGIWIFKLTGSVALMSIFASISSIISIVVVPVVSKIVDQSSKKRLIALTDLIRGIALIITALLIPYVSTKTSLFFMLATIIALCNSLFNPSISVAFSLVVNSSNYLKMNSINSTIETSIGLIGSSVFTSLALTGNIVLALIINGFLFILAGIIALKLTDNIKSTPTPTKEKSNVLSIIQYIKSNTMLRQGYLYILLFNLLVAGLSSLYLPFFISKNYNESFLSIFLLAGGIGSLLGSFILALIKDKKMSRMLHKRNFIFHGLCFMGMILSNNLILSCFLYFVSSYLMGLCNTVIITNFLKAIQVEVRGRILSFQISIILLSRAISTIIYGHLAEIFPIVSIAVVFNIMAFSILLYFFKYTKVLDCSD